MAELNPSDEPSDAAPPRRRPAAGKAATKQAGAPRKAAAVKPPPAGADLAVERALRARVAELEAVVEARTQTIVAMGARLAELQGDAPPALAQRLRDTERRLAELESTKLVRWSALPRRLYAKVRRLARG